MYFYRQVCDINDYYERVNKPAISFQGMWSILLKNADFSRDYPEITAVVEAALTICVSAADAERYFSGQNRIKTRFRNSLTKHLEASLRCHMDGPAVNKFDYAEALRAWQLRADQRGRYHLSSRAAPSLVPPLLLQTIVEEDA